MPKNREQIAAEIGVSVTTLWRKLKAYNIKLPKGPVFPRDEAEIKRILGVDTHEVTSEKDQRKEMKRNEKK